jgi:hypothetical protein
VGWSRVRVVEVEVAEVGRIALALDGVKESRAGGSVRWTLDGRLVAREYDETSIVIRIGVRGA